MSLERLKIAEAELVPVSEGHVCAIVTRDGDAPPGSWTRPGYKFHLARRRCKTGHVLDLLRFLSGLASDLVRRRVELVSENALLRLQLIPPYRKLSAHTRLTPCP